MTHIANGGDIVAVIDFVPGIGNRILSKQAVKKITPTQIVLENGYRYRANGWGIGNAQGRIELWCEEHDKMAADAKARRALDDAMHFFSYHYNSKHLTADERAAIIAMHDRVEAMKNGGGK